MSSQEAFFKIRPTKRSNPEARTTLDSLHRVRVQGILEKESELSDLKSRLSGIEEREGVTADEIEYNQLQKQKRDVQKEIERREDSSEILNYFLENGEILYNYYEVQEIIQRDVTSSIKRAPTKAKPGSVLAALETAAATEGVREKPQYYSQNTGEILRRDKLLEQYLQNVHPEHARGANAMEDD